VIGFDEMLGWQALDAYPGDTWQGGSLIVSGMQTLGEPTTFGLIDANNEFASVPLPVATRLRKIVTRSLERGKQTSGVLL
jgi:hypothetical protein